MAIKLKQERRGYVVLVGISILLSVLTILFCVHLVDGANQRTCYVLQVALLHPVPKPIGVLDTPVNQALYARYLAYVKLDRELRCKIPE
jgi:hypothetical protein